MQILFDGKCEGKKHNLPAANVSHKIVQYVQELFFNLDSTFTHYVQMDKTS